MSLRVEVPVVGIIVVLAEATCGRHVVDRRRYCALDQLFRDSIGAIELLIGMNGKQLELETELRPQSFELAERRAGRLLRGLQPIVGRARIKTALDSAPRDQ